MIEHRLGDTTRVIDNEFGCMPSRSTFETTFLWRRLMEVYRRQNLHMVFIDLEKLYDKSTKKGSLVGVVVPEKEGIPIKYI